MFLDSFETNRGVWLQACVSFPFLGESADLAEAFVAVLDTRGMVPFLNLGFRVTVTQSGDLRRILILLAPDSSEAQLRRFVASFSRLELVTPGSVEFPLDADALDSDFLGPFPGPQCRAVPSGFGSKQAWFATDFRLAPALDHFILEARALGLGVTYQMHAQPLEGRSQVLRQAKHNLLEVESLTGVPLELVRLQQSLVERLGLASYLVEEIVGVEPPGGQTWLLSALARVFAAKHFQLLFDSPGFQLSDYNDILAAGFHSTVLNPAPPDEVCAMAALNDELTRLISWSPGPVLSRELKIASRPPAEVADSNPPRESGPTPYSGREPYLFLSYKHSDWEIILPFLRDLAADGLRFWYDRGIPGASEWMGVLEERIENAQILVVFLSQSAVDSKYVRREILMADALNKRILTLTIGCPELRWGLKLILPQYQMLEAHAQPVSLAVRQALGQPPNGGP